MKKFCLILSFLLVSFIGFSQSWRLPVGYKMCYDVDGNDIRNDEDFDGDGLGDFAVLAEAKDGSKIIIVYLASQWAKDGQYWWFPWDMEYTSLGFTNGVLTISSSACAGRCQQELKLRYSSSQKNMRLIGYGDGHFADYAGRGAYERTINLLTNQYEIDGKMRSFTCNYIITLEDIEKYFIYLESIGAQYLPNY